MDTYCQESVSGVISQQYRHVALMSRNFEVIPVLDHDFRGHQSWRVGVWISFVKDFNQTKACSVWLKSLTNEIKNFPNPNLLNFDDL